jgi:hypothetical protein
MDGTVTSVEVWAAVLTVSGSWLTSGIACSTNGSDITLRVGVLVNGIRVGGMDVGEYDNGVGSTVGLAS